MILLGLITDVIIPAFNESSSIGPVIDEIPKDLIRQIIVVNNASTDDTAIQAKKAGAIVITENKKGYGAACLAGIAHVNNMVTPPDRIVFLDGDHSDFPEKMRDLLQRMDEEQADLVIGNRSKKLREKGSMTFPQRFGNTLATKLIKWFYGFQYHDLGPFRAIRFPALQQLEMKDETFGWTVEMQIKAVKKKMRIAQIDVPYRNRIGTSKISGTFSGAVKAGYKIITTIWKYR